VKYRCAYCGKTADKSAGHVNRARAAGLNLYCNRRCSGLGRRNGKTKAQKRKEKRLYDANYRKTSPTLKARRHAFHVRTYDPVKAAKVRKKRMPQHVEYCRQPWYKAWKKEYDLRHRSKKFGAFADAYRLTMELNREIKRRITNEELEKSKYQEGRCNKSQSREREAGQGKRANRHSAAHGG
jgi:hypothetical protein